MKILDHYTQAEAKRFEGDTVTKVTGRIAIGSSDGAPHFCMRLFTIEPGGHTPRHQHQWEHEILVHQGTGQVLCNGQWQEVRAGSVIFVPGNEEHQLRNHSSEDFVFACLIPRGAPEL